jgi:hypothetical protein
LRSRWFAWGVHASLWVLLYVVIMNAGGHAPPFHDSRAATFPAQSSAPIGRLDGLFATALWPKPSAGTNSANPFFTRYFVPAPSPAAPPPTTRKIEVTYQGFYETGDSPKNAVLKIGDAFVIARIGAPVATNLFVAQATMQSLTLTNLAAQTNLLLLNAKKEIEVPVK